MPHWARLNDWHGIQQYMSHVYVLHGTSIDQTLTHVGLVTTYNNRDLGPHWLRKWLAAWRHQAITWTNAGLSSVNFSDDYLRVISQEIPHINHLKITYLKFHLSLPATSELMSIMLVQRAFLGLTEII